MTHHSYALLKADASASRLDALTKKLESFGCEVCVKDKGLELKISQQGLSYVLSGCLTTVFDAYADIATWSFKFGDGQAPLEA